MKYFFNQEEDFAELDNPRRRNFYDVNAFRDFINLSVDVLDFLLIHFIELLHYQR